MPIYGECGGLMYLCGSLETRTSTYEMAGVLPGPGHHDKKTPGARVREWCIREPARSLDGTVAIRGHEFHYSKVECDPEARFAIRLGQGAGIGNGNDGMTEYSTIGAYTHAYFTDAFCRKFVAAAAALKTAGNGKRWTETRSLPVRPTHSLAPGSSRSREKQSASSASMRPLQLFRPGLNGDAAISAELIPIRENNYIPPTRCRGVCFGGAGRIQTGHGKKIRVWIRDLFLLQFLSPAST